MYRIINNNNGDLIISRMDGPFVVEGYKVPADEERVLARAEEAGEVVWRPFCAGSIMDPYLKRAVMNALMD
jgi:hypothetical protein